MHTLAHVMYACLHVCCVCVGGGGAILKIHVNEVVIEVDNILKDRLEGTFLFL